MSHEVTDGPGEVDKPAEATFVDDAEDMDLGAKVGEAWLDCRRALAGALATMPEGAELELTLDPAASGVGEALFSVTVSAGAGGQTHAYAVGNPSLPPEHRLGRAAVGELVALGWSPPGVVNGDQRFGLRQAVGDGSRLASIIVRTLRDVYGTPHPAFLVYTVSPDELRETFPALGAARALPPGGDPELEHVDLSALTLPDQVSTVIGAMMNTPPESLPVDRDGDIGIRSGSAMVFVRVRDNPPLVDVFSPVLTEVSANEALHVKLAELTHRMPIGRLYCIGDTVWASVPVFGRDFQATHLMLAVQVMTGLADELDDRLHGEFGGKRFFSDADRPGGEDADGPTAGRAKPDDHTGMYL